MFLLSLMQTQCPNERGKGANKLFQNVSLLMCYCSFAFGQFLILKNQSEKQAIELLFKVQISPDQPSKTQIRDVFLRTYPFL